MNTLRWIGGILLNFLLIQPIWAEWSVEFEQQAKGENHRTAELATYERPDDCHWGDKSLYCVRINGRYTAVYNDRNAWEKQVSFACFDLKAGTEALVEIVSANDWQTCLSLPGEHRHIFSQHNRTLSFMMKAGQSLTLVFDDNYQGEVLHLFSNTLDEEVPKPSDNLIVFAPGYHRLEHPLVLSGNKQVYLAGGAIVEGTLQIENADGARVYGHGIWTKREQGGVVVSCGFSRNVTLEGILVHNRRLSGWTVALHRVDGCKVKDLRVLSTHYASTDGFDIVNSSNIHFNNVFIRSCDDAIAIKGLIAGKPAECPPNENMTFEHLQLWNDCNNAMCLGAETRAACYRNIHFRDIDVLYSYDDRDHHTELDERSVMSIVCLEGTYFENISYEDIRVNQCERLICQTFKDSFWFGTLKGDQSTQGGIRNVTYKNITSSARKQSPITNEILLNGWHQPGTPDKYIDDITFVGIRLGRKKLRPKYIKNNNTKELRLVRNIHIIDNL